MIYIDSLLNKKHYFLVCYSIFMYFFIFNLEADVFSLIPFSGNFNGSGQELENILDGVA